ncbi:MULTISPECIES: 1-acyl-sn-glycerol-3-phosphate acyltransferase [unclassified Neisseria]|uniref:lysophospholipid acyltransferase family protein n=1 Tax=unclassified Neisseria TaxID=2623750 RepID=UPI002665988A|nr:MULTISPECIES: lysophospholipid acyltransferase family protein [unclassified Neisseria]MDO1509446.1 lysophospholipid acyltransferase family protein [Neisseria sp. MVDL19-042950]MDO1515781.1 lysophospholipid acyltransferase family protein [Neisseria sp. MVDL18-041461]MDO1563395.1 lysophospholipid acyltransferase family protein [Neisseria sp. MVDL20-010259]
MLYIRNLIYWLVLVLITPPMFTLIIPIALIPKGANHVGRAWALILVWMLKHIIGLKYRVIGRENIPDRPSIICSKHQSGWETLAFQEIFPLHVFVAKKELFKLPFFGWGLKLAKTIGIDRNNRAQANRQLLEQGMVRKKEGFWITIFPEGTRLPPGTRGKYKLGGARMAQMFEMDLVPVALNSGEFWPRNSFLKYPGEVTVVIGKPVAYDSGTAEELMKQCENWIESQQEKIDGAGPFAAKKAV